VVHLQVVQDVKRSIAAMRCPLPISPQLGMGQILVDPQMDGLSLPSDKQTWLLKMAIYS
jgi:hypothetical protein